MLVAEQLRALLWYVRATLALSRAPRQPALSSRCTLIKSRCSEMLALFWSFSLALSACSADQRVRSHAQCERMHTRAHTKKGGGFEHSAQGIPSKVMLARLVLALAFFSIRQLRLPSRLEVVLEAVQAATSRLLLFEPLLSSDSLAFFFPAAGIFSLIARARMPFEARTPPSPTGSTINTQRDARTKT